MKGTSRLFFLQQENLNTSVGFPRSPENTSVGFKYMYILFLYILYNGYFLSSKFFCVLSFS